MLFLTCLEECQESKGGCKNSICSEVSFYGGKLREQECLCSEGYSRMTWMDNCKGDSYFKFNKYVINRYTYLFVGWPSVYDISLNKTKNTHQF